MNAAASSFTRARVILLAALPGLACLPAIARAQSGCDQGQIIGQRPEQNGRIVVCSTVARRVPELEAKIDRLAAIMQHNSGGSGDVQRFIHDLNQAAERINGRQDQLAAKVVELLSAHRADSDERTARQLAQLALQLEDVEERIQQRATDPSTAQPTQQSLQGPMGEALAKLDFTSVNHMLDDLAEIKQSLTRIEHNTAPACAADAAAVQRIRDDARREMDRSAALRAEQRCTGAFTTARAVFQSAADAQSKGDLLNACLRYTEATQRAQRVATELTMNDQVAQSNAQLEAQQKQSNGQWLALQQQTYERMPHIVAMERRRALDGAHSTLLRREVAQGDEQAEAARHEAEQGHYDKAIAGMRDALRMYAGVRDQERGLLDATVPLVPQHSTPTMVIPTFHAPIRANFPDPVCPSVSP